MCWACFRPSGSLVGSGFDYVQLEFAALSVGLKDF